MARAGRSALAPEHAFEVTGSVENQDPTPLIHPRLDISDTAARPTLESSSTESVANRTLWDLR